MEEDLEDHLKNHQENMKDHLKNMEEHLKNHQESMEGHLKNMEDHQKAMEIHQENMEVHQVCSLVQVSTSVSLLRVSPSPPQAAQVTWSIRTSSWKASGRSCGFTASMSCRSFFTPSDMELRAF